MTMTAERKIQANSGLFHALRLMRSQRRTELEPDFDSVLTDWLAEEKLCVKPSTYSTYNSITARYISAALGKKRLSELNDEDVAAFMTEMSCESSGLSDATVRIIACVLRGTLQTARLRGADVNPELCKMSKKQVKTNISVLNEEERGQLIASLGPAPNKMDLGILLSLKTGLRVGEVCALKWGDIDFDERVLNVRRTLQRIKMADGTTQLYFGDPKSADSRREVPISPTSMLALHNARRSDDCFVLSGHADRPVEPRTMQRHFKFALRRAGLRDMNFHALRHTFATRCVECGFDIKSLSMILGHADVKTTMNIYVHPSPERLRTMMAAVD